MMMMHGRLPDLIASDNRSILSRRRCCCCCCCCCDDDDDDGSIIAGDTALQPAGRNWGLVPYYSLLITKYSRDKDNI